MEKIAHNNRKYIDNFHTSPLLLLLLVYDYIYIEYLFVRIGVALHTHTRARRIRLSERRKALSESLNIERS